MAAVSDWVMVSEDQVVALGLPSALVLREDYEAAVARMGQVATAAAADAVLFGDGPQEPQEEACPMPDVSVEAGVAKKPRRARRPASDEDAGRFIPDDPATPDVNEAYEPADA